MVTKIHRDALRSEAASLRKLLQDSAGLDPLGSRSLQKRLARLEAELTQIDKQTGAPANVALVFDGGPVRGSSAIDADFAGKAIQDYQELITKRVATEGGQSVEHKRIPDHLRQQSKMNITSLIHGSFGFVLEEDNANQLDMFETPTRKAVGFITDLLQEVADADGRIFEAKLDNLDARIFQALKNFISTLHKAGSTLRVAEERREIKLDTSSVDRAFNRVTHVSIEENEEVFHGELLGLVPIQRRFDFRPSDVHEVIQGRVAAILSAEYLNRIEKEGLIAGGLWRATIRTKNVRHPDKRHTSVSRILIDLVRL